MELSRNASPDSIVLHNIFPIPRVTVATWILLLKQLKCCSELHTSVSGILHVCEDKVWVPDFHRNPREVLVVSAIEVMTMVKVNTLLACCW